VTHRVWDNRVFHEQNSPYISVIELVSIPHVKDSEHNHSFIIYPCRGRQALGYLDLGYVVRSCGLSSPVRFSSSTVGLVGEQERGVD
jgi:hypothetical protein